MTTWIAVILAAGKGTRMKSKRPKVLHEVCGMPMAAHVIAAAKEAGAQQVVIVVGHEAMVVRKALGEEYGYAEQKEQLGTGHAVLQARPAGGEGIPSSSPLERGRTRAVLVLNGDVPLLRPETLRALMAHHEARHAAMTFLTARLPEAAGLGRIVRDGAGRATGIIEWAQATGEQRRQSEINVGAYCFDEAWLWSALPLIAPSKSGEIYLTDMAKKTRAAGKAVETMVLDDANEAIGVDTRQRLAQAESIMRQRIREHWMTEGVTLIDPPSIMIDAGARIGVDTVIHPQTVVRGRSIIGEDCEIGPWSIVADSTIGNGCKVLSSVIEGSTMENHIDVGPFSHLRPGAYLENHVHVGNYVEIKNSRLKQDAKSGHFSYIGDANIGRNVNIGAGTITCNFDGINKLPTVIEDDAFIGCDTMLIAPIKIGARSKTGAGSVVTRDVPADTLVAGVPARPLVKPVPK